MSTIQQFDEIEVCDYQNLKNGRDFTLKTGEILKNNMLTQDPPSPKSYAFCSDTSYFPEIIPQIKNVNCLYHETTFLKDKEKLAATTKHSTAEQAAKIAKEADVKKLIIGHFSGRYKNKEAFLDEATLIFEDTILAEEGKTFVIE